MRRWLANLGSVGLALLLAITVWLVAVREENPQDWFAETIAVNRTGLTENLSVFGEMVEQVRIEVRAPKQRWRDLAVTRLHCLGRSGESAGGRV